jgi:peptidoglycan/LPS O-acetylase OafA/YrhL
MNRNRFLDILKGIAILFIIITHYNFSAEARLHYLFPFWIDMAVPVFLMISGYVATMSFRKQNITTIEQAYTLRIIGSKAIRYTVPFIIAWLVEYADMVRVYGSSGFTWSWFIWHFLEGGEGPGAYYFPIMMQFIFVFPLLYFLIEAHGFVGLVIAFMATYAMEVLKIVYQMGENTYCLLIFRYTFIIAAGVYLASSHYKKRIIISLCALVVGTLFLVGTQYYGVEVPYIGMWQRTSLFGCLFIAPIIGALINKCSNWHFLPLEVVGKASYNIFLVQKVFYKEAGIFYEKIPGTKLDFIATILICVGVGIVFYLVESPFTSWLVRNFKNYTEKHHIPDAWR